MDNFLKKISIPAWKYLQNEGIRSEIYHIISVDSTILQNIQCTDPSCHKSNHQLIPWVTCRGFFLNCLHILKMCKYLILILC